MKTVYILICLFCTKYISAQNIFDETHTRKYADYLQFRFEYKKATIEYHTCLKQNPSDDTLKEIIAGNYLRLKKYNEGLALCKTIAPQYYSKNTSLLFLNHCRSANQYQQADSLIKTKYYHNDSLQLVWQLEYQLSKLDYRHYYKWLKQNDSIYQYLNATEDYYTSVMRAHPKSPLKAALMSTIIPGWGKMYTQYKHDGFVAFVSVATSAFQAYRGFHKQGIKSAYGWIYGGVGVGMYLGNIYGSWKSAKKYNSEQKIYYKKKVEVLTFNLL